MYKPCLETPIKRKKDFDPNLCIICQKKVIKPKRGRPKLIEASSFEIFNKVFKLLEEKRDRSYSYIYDVTKDKTPTALINENCCFHAIKFQRILSNHQRPSYPYIDNRRIAS